MTTLDFSVLWRDHGAAKGLQDLARHTEKTSASMKGLKVAAAFGLVAVAAAAVKFGTSSVRAYSDAENAQKSLAFAFAKFPKLADTNQAALQKLNTALQQKTRFDDDNIASGQAVLAQFKLTGQQITQVTPLLLDYASKTGKDIPQAANDVGKALLGNAKALKNIGIFYKSTGDAGKDFTNVTALMREKVGGFAELEGKTASGRLAILKNQFGELQETVGSALVPALSKVVGVITPMVQGFNNLDDSAKTTLVTIGGGVLTLGLSALAVGKLAVGVRSARDAFRALGITAKGATIATVGIGAVVGIAALAFGAYAEHSAKAKQAVEDYTEALKEDNNQLGVNVRLLAAKKLQDEGAFAAATKLGIGLNTVTDAALGNASAQAEVNRVTDDYVQAALNSADVDTIDRKNAALILTDAIGGQNKAVSKAVSNAKEMATAAGTAGTSTATAGVKVKTAGEKAADAERKFQALAASMFKTSAAGLELSGTEISFQQAIDDATAAAKANGKTLDTNTQKGRDNKTALNNLVTASQAYIQKLVATHASSKRVTQATKDAKAEFIRVAEKMGVSAGKAKDLADKYFHIPKSVKTETSAPGMKNTQAAVKKLHDLIANVKSKNVDLDVAFHSNPKAFIKAMYKQFGLDPSITGNPYQRAFGGPLPGSASSDRADNVLYRGTPGEWVIQRPTARYYGGGAMKAINERRVPREALQGFAYGGEVNRTIKVHGHANDVPPIRWAMDQARIGQLAAAQEAASHFGDMIGKKAKEAFATGGLAPGAGGGRGLVSYHGGTFTALFRNNLIRAENAAGVHPRIFQGGWRPRTSYSGTTHMGDAVDYPQIPALLRAFRHLVGAMWMRGPAQGFIYHMHGVPAPGRGYGSASARWQYQDYLRGGNGLAGGGVATRPGFYPLAERGPERVLSAYQTRLFERLVDRRGGTGNVQYNITINAPNYLGSKADFKQELVRMASRGDFDVIVKRAAHA